MLFVQRTASRPSGRRQLVHDQASVTSNRTLYVRVSRAAAHDYWREYVLDLGGANTVSECAERAMGSGVAVATNNHRARKRETLFRSDDMEDALSLVEFAV